MASLDACLAPGHFGSVELAPSLVIDMENVEFILIECLVALIAEIGQRERAGLATAIRLPLSRHTRGFLRDWSFPQAFRRTTGISLMSLVDRDNLARIREFDLEHGEKQDRRYGAERVYQTPDGLQRVPLEFHRYFGFRQWQPVGLPGDPLRFGRFVIDECRRWVQDPVVTRVLRAQLGQFYAYVAGVIIHEALSNAFRHGEASSVIMVTKGEPKPDGTSNRFFTLVFWDNGCPSYETLRRPLESGKKISGTSQTEDPELIFQVKAPFDGGLPHATKFTSGNIPRVEACDWELFLSTLYPGVTCDPDGNSRFDASAPGRGLTNLLNAAIDVFGGSVAFRSGEYFMNVKALAERRRRPDSESRVIDAAPPQPHYAVKLNRSWRFFGNMVTVRLPIRTA